MTPRIRLRLRKVAHGDFRTSEHTMYKSLPAALRNSLKGNDAVCFVSGTGNQLVFVYKYIDVGITRPTHPGVRARRYGIIASIRLRLTGSTWNPLMLQNYATDYCGIELIGLKRFEEHYERLAKEAA